MANSQSVILLVCLASYISLSICFPCLQQEGITTTPLLTVVAGDSSAVLRLQGMMWTLYPTVLDTNNVVQVLEQASVTVAFNGLQEIGTINGGHFNPLVGGTPFPESPFLFPIYSSVFFKDMNCTYSQRLDYRGGAVVVNITTISAAHPAYPQFSFVSNLATTTQTFSEIDYVDKLTNQSVNATYLADAIKITFDVTNYPWGANDTDPPLSWLELGLNVQTIMPISEPYNVSFRTISPNGLNFRYQAESLDQSILLRYQSQNIYGLDGALTYGLPTFLNLSWNNQTGAFSSYSKLFVVNGTMAPRQFSHFHYDPDLLGLFIPPTNSSASAPQTKETNGVKIGAAVGVVAVAGAASAIAAIYWYHNKLLFAKAHKLVRANANTAPKTHSTTPTESPPAATHSPASDTVATTTTWSLAAKPDVI